MFPVIHYLGSRMTHVATVPRWAESPHACGCSEWTPRAGRRPSPGQPAPAAAALCPGVVLPPRFHPTPNPFCFSSRALPSSSATEEAQGQVHRGTTALATVTRSQNPFTTSSESGEKPPSPRVGAVERHTWGWVTRCHIVHHVEKSVSILGDQGITWGEGVLLTLNPVPDLHTAPSPDHSFPSTQSLPWLRKPPGPLQ